MTERTENEPAEGWVFFDGRCGMCRRQVDRWEKPIQKHGFVFVPQQEDWVQRRLGLSGGQTAEEMKVLTHDRRIRGGMDAILYLAWFFWWARPLALIARVPGVFHLLRAIYRQVARRRYCFGGNCEIHIT